MIAPVLYYLYYAPFIVILTLPVALLTGCESMQTREGGAVLGALTRLKQVCNHPAHFLGDGSGVLRRGYHRSGKLGLVDEVRAGSLGGGTPSG